LIATDALQLLSSANVNEFHFTEDYPNFGITKNNITSKNNPKPENITLLRKTSSLRDQ
jgi:hypothetical protein